ncbi:unnamed protein product [Rotaria sp. Silwood1]|nr:unnamed protein product [Rotaria sp. Silwood1]CAF1681699.1 unnamed protein product [Rotaria sp. Silwood1]
MSELSATPKSTLIGCDENELLHYLHDRYTANHIYTYVGSILIAVNPHQQADNLFVHVLFVNEILFFDLYKVDWQIEYEELKEEPVIISSFGQIQILTKESKKAGSLESSSSYVKMFRYRNKSEAQYIVDKITNVMMHTIL